MSRTALFPGSFDPITNGHTDIISRGLTLFDKIIIGIGKNSKKKGLFPIEKRKEWLEDLYKDEPRIAIEIYSGLTVRFCESKNIQFILRGIRNSLDFEYEKTIAQLNNDLNNGIETVLLVSNLANLHISSTIVREILINNGPVSSFVPAKINEVITEYGK